MKVLCFVMLVLVVQAHPHELSYDEPVCVDPVIAQLEYNAWLKSLTGHFVCRSLTGDFFSPVQITGCCTDLHCTKIDALLYSSYRRSLNGFIREFSDFDFP